MSVLCHILQLLRPPHWTNTQDHTHCGLTPPMSPSTEYYIIAKCQYSCTRNVLWCRVLSSHIHANYKTSSERKKKTGNNKHPAKKSFINKYMRNPADTKLCISHKFGLLEIYLFKSIVLIKAIIIISMPYFDRPYSHVVYIL